jgi:hypothetical protein
MAQREREGGGEGGRERESARARARERERERERERRTQTHTHAHTHAFCDPSPCSAIRAFYASHADAHVSRFPPGTLSSPCSLCVSLCLSLVLISCPSLSSAFSAQCRGAQPHICVHTRPARSRMRPHASCHRLRSALRADFAARAGYQINSMYYQIACPAISRERAR